MKIEVFSGKWKGPSYITFVTNKTETDLMFHINEWSTPYVMVNITKYSWSLIFSVLCFSVMFSYTRKAWNNLEV